MPADPSDVPATLLSPLLSNLPSISGISEMAPIGALKSFLPKSPSPGGEILLYAEDTTASWHDADLGGGKSRVLVLTSPQRALQVFAFTDSVIPDDPHVQETFPAPVELASIPDIVYQEGAEHVALPEAEVRRDPRNETVLAACLLDRRMWGDHGPVVAVATHMPGSASTPHGLLAVALVSLRTGQAFRRLDLGKGVAASISCSTRAIAITLSHPPSIHVVNERLESVTPPITGLPAHPQSSLPVVALSGRLLAYATGEPPATPGADGLGSIVTATTSRPRNGSVSSAGSAATAAPQTTQGAILSSAVEIGGGVARGVWAGLRAGAKAASQASSGRLASSAPNDPVLGGASMSPPISDATGESRSVEEGVAADIASPNALGGVWIKIVDLFPSSSSETNLICHFRLPPLRHLVPPMPTQRPRASSSVRDQPVSLLAFSPDGTRLFAAPTDGRAFHVLEVRPRAAIAAKPGTPRGEVWDSYILRRGNTPAQVRSVAWSRDERYVAVGTGRGTIHVFPICPGGGKPTAASHTPLKLTNAHLLPALSVEVTPSARIRPYRNVSTDDLQDKAKVEAEAKGGNAIAAFTALRTHPLDKGTLCQDVVIFRCARAELDLARLAAHQTAMRTSSPAPEPHRRLSSNLTEMMQAKTGLRSEADLDVKSAVIARWALPLGVGGPRDVDVLPPSWASSGPAEPESTTARGAIHHAEIRTHSVSPRILPTSIYLSHQVEFFAATPTDAFSPLSVLDKVARTRRLTFRPEVEVRRGSTSEASSLDEINSALHSMMDSRPSTQVPALPNGSPSKAALWSIPMRQVAANLGEGIDAVRREYARAQQKRNRRRSEAGGTPLSFEDDTVFATVDDDASSAPSSGPLPPTIDDGDGEWGDRWEDEYRRAVEDDGGAEDLVLGLLDEEEDERRRWEQRQKLLKKEYAKGAK